MKLLQSFGPNPRMVRMFIAEKGLSIPFESVDLFGAENRQEAYRKKNPAGGIPCLELDDGHVLSETGAICEFLEELHPAPALIGSSAWERAETRMNLRRVELQATEYLYNAFRFGPGLALFEHRFRCVPEAADGLRAKGLDGVALLDTLLEGQTYVCGERLTVADLTLYCCLDFCLSTGLVLDPALSNISAWLARMNARPSAAASLSAGWQEIGMKG